MPHLLEPRNLEIQAKWDGEVGHAVDISVSLEIESEPDTQLHLLDARTPSVSLKQSFLRRLPQFDQGHAHPDAEALDDTCSRYFSVDEGTSVKRQPKDDNDEPRTPYTRDTEFPSSPPSRLFPPSPASAEKAVKSLHSGASVPERCELGDAKSTESQQPMSPGSSSTTYNFLHFPDQGSNEQDAEVQIFPDNDTTTSEDAAATSSFADSRASEPPSSPRPLSRTSLKIIKREERSRNQLMRKRTAKDAGLSDSGSNSPNEQHIDVEGSTAHNEIPTPDLNSSLLHAPDLALQTRSVKRSQHAKVPLGTTIRTDRPSLIPIRTAPASETRVSPTKLCGPSYPINPKEDGPSHEYDSPQKPFCSEQGDDIFSEREVFNTKLSTHIMPLVPPEAPGIAVEETYEDETIAEDDISRDDADAIDYEEASVGDLSLPPSPSPSSQDIMPWKSTSELFDCPKFETHHDQEEKVHEWGYCGGSGEDPEVVLEDGHLLLRNSSTVRRAFYKATFTASILLKPESDGWLSLVIPGLPKTSNSDHGALFFDTPPNRGIEFQTTGLHASEIVHHCFQARFLLIESLHVSFRLLNSKNYILPSFDVEQEIRADSVMVKNKLQPNEYHLLVAYHALCSLQVHGVCFSAEKCSFAVHVDGGPQGQFICELEPRPGLQVIRLDAGGERPIGVSHVEVVCAPRSLEAFGITWSVKVDGTKSSTWLPRIYPAVSTTYTREGNHLRRIFANVEAMMPSDDEDGAGFGTFVDDDEEDVQSTASSEMVMYPRKSRDESFSVSTAPCGIAKAWRELILKLRRDEVAASRTQVVVTILVLIVYCLAGLSRIQWISGNPGYSPWGLENLIPGSILGLDNGQQTFGDRLLNFSILGAERLREALLGNICKEAGNFPDGEHSHVASETSVEDGDREIDEAPSDALAANQVELDAATGSSCTDEDVITPVRDTALPESVRYVPDTVLGSNEEASKVSRSLRDRMDYFLGWKGPLDG
ncbi:hypothetical protein VTN77DRAFT_6106 [Rasamsonia byssochlamydoides]|uniref:uncharacterized protein n=1 Tax=Rasamsonia byssochlamydoides TaxID=89139 RepID=UPI003744A50E